MDCETIKKIQKFEGLDFCDHGKQRLYCPICMWDVPAIYRQKREKFIEEKVKKQKNFICLDHGFVTHNEKEGCPKCKLLTAQLDMLG